MIFITFRQSITQKLFPSSAPIFIGALQRCPLLALPCRHRPSVCKSTKRKLLQVDFLEKDLILVPMRSSSPASYRYNILQGKWRPKWERSCNRVDYCQIMQLYCILVALRTTPVDQSKRRIGEEWSLLALWPCRQRHLLVIGRRWSRHLQNILQIKGNPWLVQRGCWSRRIQVCSHTVFLGTHRQGKDIS